MDLVSSRARSLIFLLLLAMGCQSKPATTTSESSEDGGTAVASADGSKSKKSLIPVKRNVKTLEGNWVLVMTNQRSDNYLWLIKFSKSANGKIAAEFLDTSRSKEEADKPQIVGTEVDGDQIRLSLKNAGGPFDFVGSFQQGFIRGTIRSTPKDVFLTRLLPTDETSLERFNATGLPPASDIFEALMKNKETKPDDILNTLRENRTSPIAQDFFAMLMAGHVQANFEEAKVKELIESYLSAASQWGERWVGRIEMNIAANLINGRKFIHLALPHLDSAEQKMGEDRGSMAEILAPFRDAANTNMRIQEISSPASTADARAAAYEELVQLLKKQRYNPEILAALASEAEKNGQIDTAMEYLSEVVALPMLEATVIRARAGQPPDTPTPSEALKKLWSQKNGTESEEGYLQYVDDIYRQKIGSYLTEIQQHAPAIPPSEAGNRTVLVELLTGMQCPPCVAADLALSAIGKTFPTSEVIVIRHHQHVPLPDGLVNQDSEERGAFYETGAAPTVAVDGIVIDPRYYAGPIQIAGSAYSVFRKVIDPRVAEKTDITLNLTASVTDGQLNASVVANGISDDLLPSCRLRMAIVENEVRTIVPNGSNGIRDHEYLVREMLGGAKGIPPKKGELKYSITIPMAEIQEHAVDYIKRYETGRGFQFPEPMKPPIRGALSLVAWVQNDKVNPEAEIKAKIILQSAIIPITGFAGDGAESTTNSTKHPAIMPEAESVGSNQPAGASGAETTESAPPPPALPE